MDIRESRPAKISSEEIAHRDTIDLRCGMLWTVIHEQILGNCFFAGNYVGRNGAIKTDQVTLCSPANPRVFYIFSSKKVGRFIRAYSSHYRQIDIA